MNSTGESPRTIGPVDRGTFELVIGVVAVLVVLVTVGLLAPIPHYGRVSGTIGDLCHTPLFMAVTATLLWAGERLWPSSKPGRTGTAVMAGVMGRIAGAIALVLLGSIAMEVIQDFVGRNASWKDVRANAWGIVAGCVLHVGWIRAVGGHGRQFWLAAAVAMGCVIISSRRPVAVLMDVRKVHTEFPLLSDFESKVEFGRWYVHNGGRGQSRHLVTHGRWGGVAKLQPSDHAGFTLIEMHPDWTGYRELVFDIEIDEQTSQDVQRLLVQVVGQSDPAQRHPVIQYRFDLAPGQRRTIRCPLGKSADNPAFDLARVQFLDLHLLSVTESVHYHLDHVRLE